LAFCGSLSRVRVRFFGDRKQFLSLFCVLLSGGGGVYERDCFEKMWCPKKKDELGTVEDYVAIGAKVY